MTSPVRFFWDADLTVISWSNVIRCCSVLVVRVVPCSPAKKPGRTEDRNGATPRSTHSRGLPERLWTPKVEQHGFIHPWRLRTAPPWPLIEVDCAPEWQSFLVDARLDGIPSQECHM